MVQNTTELPPPPRCSIEGGGGSGAKEGKFKTSILLIADTGYTV